MLFVNSRPTVVFSYLLFAEQLDNFNGTASSTVAYTTNSPNTSEYLSDAVTIITPNTQGWTYHPLVLNSMYIVNNKIDRAFRGIWVEGTEDMETEIAGNNIFLEEDFTYGAPAFGYGVGAKDKTDSLAITGNTVVGNIATSQGSKISSIYCEQIGGMYSPSVTCNFVDMSHYGFEFSGWNGSAYWRKNTMCNNFGGLALTNNGVIGQQGDPQNGMGNIWSIFCLPAWGMQFGINYTYCDNSNPMLSPLFCRNSPGAVPFINASVFPALPYTYNSTYFDNSNTMPDCLWSNNYNPAPTWRSQNTGERDTARVEDEKQAVKVYPNPAETVVNIYLPSVETGAELNIYNSLGKLVTTQNLTQRVTELSVLNYTPGLYVFEVNQGEHHKRFKIIIKN